MVAAAEEALERQKFVSVIDVCIGLGWLHSRHVDNWRQGRVAPNPSCLCRTLAVVASVRHENTDYDELLMSGVPRAEARDQIKDTIDEVLEPLSLGRPTPDPKSPGSERARSATDLAHSSTCAWRLTTSSASS